ncbi:MAG TPA: proton-conducting transporter membrane subunit [Gammaproteobacteria bacterium]
MIEGVSLWVPLLPMVAALLIALRLVAGAACDDAAERGVVRLTLWASGLALVVLLGLDLRALWLGAAPGQLRFGTWLASGDYHFPISLMLDTLGLAMATLVALIAFLTLRFSVNYMHREAGFQRFFMVMSLFTGAMLLIVMAGSALLLFIGWELAGVSSFLLIAYSWERPVATRHALRAFVTNRIGDAGFLFAIFLSFAWLGSVEWPQMLARASGLESLGAGLLAGGFLVAALAKSGQLPFAPWIGRALEGPTPSSAIFYGALMVHAGVYLVIRLGPIFEQSPAVMVLLALLGALTALYGFLGGLVQSDVKSSLMFATTGQVGLMFLACGLGWFELAALHLGGHALWRTYQFLLSPALLYQADRPVRAVPAWLRHRHRLHTAVMQRFWLDALADNLLVRPTQELARDAHNLDERVISRLVGMHAETAGEAAGKGAPDRLVTWFADAAHRFEERLIFRRGGGLGHLLHRIGDYLREVENLLERPRYLLLLIMATLVVIL